MKHIFFGFLILIASVSYAKSPSFTSQEEQNFEVQKDYIAGEIVSVGPLCPEGVMCFINGTILRVKFELTNGCEFIDSLDSTVTEKGVVVEAVRVTRGEMCTMAMKYPVETLTLVNVYPPFQIAFKGTNVVFDIADYTN